MQEMWERSKSIKRGRKSQCSILLWRRNVFERIDIMKCKYCKTQISFFNWLYNCGECDRCQCENWTRRQARERKDSQRYWDKQKEE